jgi:hypothetical protein
MLTPEQVLRITRRPGVDSTTAAAAAPPGVKCPVSDQHQFSVKGIGKGTLKKIQEFLE